jgi:WD40 repeat protein
VQSVVFSSTGDHLATAHWGPRTNSISVWNVASRQPIAMFDSEIDTVNALAFFGNGKYLAAAGDGGVMAWPVSADQSSPRTPLFKQAGWRCLSIAVADDDNLIVWPNNETEIRGWDVQQSAEVSLHTPPMLQGWHGLQFIPQTRLLAYVNQAGLLEVYDVDQDRSAQLPNSTMFQAPHIALSQDGQWLAGLAKPDTASIWDVTARTPLLEFRPERNAIWALAWSPQGKHLAVGLSDGGLVVWDMTELEKVLSAIGLGWSEGRIARTR